MAGCLPTGVWVDLRQESEQGYAAERAALLQPRQASCRRPDTGGSRLLSCVHRNYTQNPTGGAGSETRSPVTRPHFFRPVEVGNPALLPFAATDLFKASLFFFFNRTYQYFKSGLLFEHLSLSLELSNDEMHTAHLICHQLSLVC